MTKISRSLLLMISLFIVVGAIAPLTASAQPRRHHRYHHRHHRHYRRR